MTNICIHQRTIFLIISCWFRVQWITVDSCENCIWYIHSFHSILIMIYVQLLFHQERNGFLSGINCRNVICSSQDISLWRGWIPRLKHFVIFATSVWCLCFFLQELRLQLPRDHSSSNEYNSFSQEILSENRTNRTEQGSQMEEWFSGSIMIIIIPFFLLCFHFANGLNGHFFPLLSLSIPSGTLADGSFPKTRRFPFALLAHSKQKISLSGRVFWDFARNHHDDDPEWTGRPRGRS